MPRSDRSSTWQTERCADMRSNIIILAVLAVFFYLSAVAYTLWHIAAYDGQVEWAGTLGLALTGIMSTFIAFYLVLTRRGQHGDMPADRLDAEIDDGDPDRSEERRVGKE